MTGAQPSGAAPAPAIGAQVRLEVRDLEVRIGAAGPDVVSEIGFAVPAGEVLGLVGESGSGKTTVALALLGHARRGLRIRGGEVLLDGDRPAPAEPGRTARGARRQGRLRPPGSVRRAQPGAAGGHATARGLEVHPGVASDPAGRVREVMREARLDATPEMLRRYPHQLSGGQQQRVSLAMAFCCRPSLIVLDEPTTGLDVSTQRHVLETVRSLCRSYGVAAVYVSHDLAVVGGLVSEVAVMYAGRIIEIGPTAKVFGEPLHPYTRGLLAAVPSPLRAEVLTGIEGQPPRPGRRGPGCSFAARCGFAVGECRARPPAPALIDGRAVRCIRVTEIAAASPQRPAVVTGPAPAEARPRRCRCARCRPVTGARRCCPASTSTCRRSPASRSSASPVPARRRWPAASSACTATGPARSAFDGTPLARGARDRPKDVLRRVQYIFQNPYTSLNPRKTVGQIVAQPLEQFLGLPFRERSERAAAVLEDVGLGGDFAGRYPDQLSGGERQRVAIARALVVEPDLLICDEVTSALDVSVQAVIVEELRRLQRERQLAMIFITHNLALVRCIAQSAVVLCDGAVVESGPVEQILEHPENPYTIRLMADVPKLGP